MSLCIDIRSLTRGRHTGVEEYLINVLKTLLKQKQQGLISFDIFLFAACWQKVNLETKIPGLNEYFNTLYFKIPSKFFNFYLKFLGWLLPIDKIIKLIFKQKVNIFFCPNLAELCPVSKKIKKITTVHDLSFVHFPEYFNWRHRLRHFFVNPKKQAQTSDVLIAVSESTKKDLINVYKITRGKIKVIYSGVDEKYFKVSSPSELERVKKKYSLPDNFILYLGTIEPRKNLINLIRAFEYYKRGNPPCPPLKKGEPNNHHDRMVTFPLIKEARGIKLLLCGSPGWSNKKIYKKAKQSTHKKDIIIRGFISEKDKPHLYKLAKIFVYPSFFEGFGFPPLEAMASGTPVITSNNSSLPEVVGNAALMVNAYRTHELFLAFKFLLEEEKLRKNLIEKGKRRAKKFRWEKTAKEMTRIFSLTV